MTLKITFCHEWQDCYEGEMTLGDAYTVKAIAKVYLLKKHVKKKSDVAKELTGSYFVNFVFEDSFYSMNLVINRRPVRMKLLQAETLPPEMSLAFYVRGRQLISPDKWTEAVRRIQAETTFTTGGRTRCSVLWNVTGKTDAPFFTLPGDEDDDFADDEWF